MPTPTTTSTFRRTRSETAALLCVTRTAPTVRPWSRTGTAVKRSSSPTVALFLVPCREAAGECGCYTGPVRHTTRCGAPCRRSRRADRRAGRRRSRGRRDPGRPARPRAGSCSRSPTLADAAAATTWACAAACERTSLSTRFERLRTSGISSAIKHEHQYVGERGEQLQPQTHAQLPGDGEPEPDAARGMDPAPIRVVTELLAQRADVDVERLRRAPPMHVPDLGDRRSRQPTGPGRAGSDSRSNSLRGLDGEPHRRGALCRIEGTESTSSGESSGCGAARRPGAARRGSVRHARAPNGLTT